MRIATWNINSVRLRIHHVLRFIKEQNIDVMCLQETKTEDIFFPIDDFESISKYANLPESKIATKLKLHNHPTVIYQKTKPSLKHVSNENNEIAIRITPIIELKKIIKVLNAPIISTSANISGQPFPINFNDIDKNITSAVDLMLNFEVESTGIPSTIIRIDETGELQYLR